MAHVGRTRIGDDREPISIQAAVGRPEVGREHTVAGTSERKARHMRRVLIGGFSLVLAVSAFNVPVGPPDMKATQTQPDRIVLDHNAYTEPGLAILSVDSARGTGGYVQQPLAAWRNRAAIPA